MRGNFSFDTRGFTAALKLLSVVVLLGTGVQYAAPIAADYMYASAAASETTATSTASIPRPTEDEAQVLQKLNSYEEQLSTRTIGTASIDTIAQAHERMIAADLSEMKLYLFENGHATSTFPILSKGKRGTRWETPTGLYKIETKETNHYSTIGNVNMPYSMEFFGNFFIHGWPTYPDGTPVPEGFSGGCIRLSTEDAEKVYEFAKRGTPIFVSDTPEASSTPVSVSQRALPRVSADAFIIADIKTGSVYAEKNASKQYPIASISKLLTALVANETIHFDRTITINSDDRSQTEGSPGSIRKGDTFTVGELFYPLLMESNNSAAYALARYNNETTFVSWMNNKAKAIGMDDTSMDDPSGLSANNVSTASDLFKLMRYIHDSQSFILNLSREPNKTMKAENGHTYTFANFNVFPAGGEFLGGKVGYTPEAHETMATVWEVPLNGATSTIAVIVLHSEDRKTDIQKLIQWFKQNAHAN